MNATEASLTSGTRPGEVCVVATGSANLASVLAALERLGVEVRLTDRASDVSGATRLVLPGVGAFGAAMRTLHERGLVEPLRERLMEGRPTLCICLGMQLLARESEESPGVRGLGVMNASVRRLEPGQGRRVPQLGWNRVECVGSAYLSSGWAYYAHSYALTETPAGWLGATTEYGVRFCGAIERRGVLACQFHPELSGPWGAGVIRSWLERSTEMAREVAPGLSREGR